MSTRCTETCASQEPSGFNSLYLAFSVVAMETRQYMPGDVITMRLMRREKGVLVALPSSQWVKVEEPIRFGGERLCARGSSAEHLTEHGNKVCL